MRLATTTNVKPTDLNYDRYTRSQYDRDIVRAIPFHQELHERLLRFLVKKFNKKDSLSILDLGTGTAITSAIIRDVFPAAQFDLVDFSRKMLAGARERMGQKNVRYILEDFALLKFDRKYDIIMTVIGLHHQTALGTQRLFKKMSKQLKRGGLLVIGDLVTHTDKHLAALSNAKHYHHLVENAANEKSLAEWAYHHQFLNDLKTLENYQAWLKAAGLKLVYTWSEWNTALLIAEKV